MRRDRYLTEGVPPPDGPLTGLLNAPDRDTAQWTLVGYAQAKGANNERQIRAIVVAFGTLQFIGPDQDVLHATQTVYSPAADADGDGLPDPGAVPVLTIPGIIETGRRVPVLQ